MTATDSNALLEMYCDAAARYKRAFVGGNRKATNAAHAELNKLLAAMVSAGCDHRLCELLGSKEPWTRYCAAAHLLEVDERAASDELARLSGLGLRFLSLQAEITLDEWRQGNLKWRQ